MKLEKI